MQNNVLFSGSTTLPRLRGHVRRPRIDGLLNDLLDRYLVIVAAGAGSGKTHAVSAYLHSVQARVFWFQLSELDNNLTRFWGKFIYAIELHNQETAAQLDSLGFPDTLMKYDKFLHILAKEIYSRQQAIFVFDDFHLIHEETVLRFVQSLFLAKLENLCIIINTRKNPNFHLTGMLSNDLAGQITAEDLSFTLVETEEYLTQQGVSLSKREIEKVHAYTQGWPLALYLVGLSVKKNGTVSRGPLSGATPLIYKMIEDELFSQYAPQVQNFLLRASLLNSFPDSLIKTLAGEHADTILEIIQNNMFIYANPYTGHFDFHHLFLDFLHGKQEYLSQQEINETYLMAAEWCAANDLKIEALTYYDKCGRYEEIIYNMLNFGVAVFSKSIADFYISLIDKLPADLIAQNPLLHVHRAGLLCNNAQVQPAIRELLEAQKELELLPTQANRAVLGEICCMLGLIYLGMADYAFVQCFEKANEYLPNGSAMIDNSGMAVNTRYAIMLSSPAPGELKKMEDAMFYAMPYATKIMHGYGQGLEYLASAEASYFTGDMKNAAKNAHEAVYRAREKQVADIASGGYFLLMRIEAANGNYDGVTLNLARMNTYVEGLEDKWNFNGMPDVAAGWFSLLFNNAQSIANWLVDDTLGDSVLAPYSMGIERSLKAKYFLKSGKYYELLAWLAQSEKPLRQNSIWLGLLDLLIAKAIALYNLHDETEALAALREAYEIAHENQLTTQFAEHGSEIRALIYCARHSEANAIPSVWLDEIHAKSATYEKHLRNMRAQHRQTSGQATAPMVKFTKREKEILSYVCQGLTNAEIASICYISLSAVKKTLINIYAKLGAANRADAVRTALQMKI